LALPPLSPERAPATRPSGARVVPPAGAPPAGAPLTGAPLTGDLLDWDIEMDQKPETPEDPVLARLLPDGYRDDPDASQEFRKYTEPSLRSAKQQAAQEMLDTLPEAGGKIQLTHDQAQAWLKALNDVRLALGVRLDVTEEFEEQWSRLAADDPQWAAYEVYAWLGAVQESLVQALA
jgi:Domain of unknown function (DUF2017)